MKRKSCQFVEGGGFFLRRVCGEVCLMTVSSSTRACSSRDPFACTHDGVRLCGNILELVRTSKNSLIFVLMDYETSWMEYILVTS